MNNYWPLPNYIIIVPLTLLFNSTLTTSWPHPRFECKKGVYSSAMKIKQTQISTNHEYCEKNNKNAVLQEKLSHDVPECINMYLK